MRRDAGRSASHFLQTSLPNVTMLGLRHATPDTFVDRFELSLEEMLIDHAHCEKKAAAAALAFIAKYPDYPDIVSTMAEIVEEEMAHFRQVLGLLDARGWTFRGMRGSKYAGRLHAVVRDGFGPGLVDRLLVAAMIEARSCERFALLGRRLSDPELRAFYQSLFESEARHYATYVKLALAHGPEAEVRQRLDELLALEASAASEGEDAARLHA